jgi:hypothetical protein
MLVENPSPAYATGRNADDSLRWRTAKVWTTLIRIRRKGPSLVLTFEPQAFGNVPTNQSKRLKSQSVFVLRLALAISAVQASGQQIDGLDDWPIHC